MFMKAMPNLGIKALSGQTIFAEAKLGHTGGNVQLWEGPIGPGHNCPPWVFIEVIPTSFSGAEVVLGFLSPTLHNLGH